MTDPFLEAIENLSRFHREHEKFYAQESRQQAVVVSDSAGLVNDNERRWRVFRERVLLLADQPSPTVD